MQWLSRAEFAATVSNAGGLGLITATTFPTKEGLVEEIRKARSLTDKPFGVNISMLPEVTKDDKTPQFFKAVIEEKVSVVETSGRSPEAFDPDLKKAGIKLIHKVPAVRFAKKAKVWAQTRLRLLGLSAVRHGDGS